MPKRVPSHFSSNDQNKLGDPTNYFHTECFDLCEAFHQSNLKETPVILLSFKLRSNNAANRKHEKELQRWNKKVMPPAIVTANRWKTLTYIGHWDRRMRKEETLEKKAFPKDNNEATKQYAPDIRKEMKNGNWMSDGKRLFDGRDIRNRSPSNKACRFSHEKRIPNITSRDFIFLIRDCWRLVILLMVFFQEMAFAKFSTSEVPFVCFQCYISKNGYFHCGSVWLI